MGESMSKQNFTNSFMNDKLKICLKNSENSLHTYTSVTTKF